MAPDSVSLVSKNPWAGYINPVKPVEGGKSTSTVAGHLASLDQPAVKMGQPPAPAGCKDIAMA